MMDDTPKPPDGHHCWLDYILCFADDMDDEEPLAAEHAKAELAELRRLAAIGKLVEDSEADVEAGRLTDHEDVKRELG